MHAVPEDFYSEEDMEDEEVKDDERMDECEDATFTTRFENS